MTEQTYPNIQHVIVGDGPSTDVRNIVREFMPNHIRYKWTNCGQHWSSLLPNSYTAIPLMTATALADGDYHMWLADDERMIERDHIEALVDLLESKNVDFVYPRVELYMAHNPGRIYTIGTEPPRFGQFTHCLYKVELLKLGMYRPFVGSAGDWDVCARWLEAGATYAMLPRVTLSHKADK